jgi:hypothetical protein
MPKDDSVEEKYSSMTVFKNNSKDSKLPFLYLQSIHDREHKDLKFKSSVIQNRIKWID